MATFLMTLLMLAGVFLMFIVLLQRGRGGGLAGAFGGAGGQSVLGVKAGDVFTKITVGVALGWVILAGVSGIFARSDDSRYEAGEDADVEDEDKKTEEADIQESDEAPKSEDSETDNSLVDDLKNESAETSEPDSEDDGKAQTDSTKSDSTESDSTESDSTESDSTGEPGNDEKTDAAASDEKKEPSEN